jgi:hypothetical protein
VEESDLCLPQWEMGVMLCMYVCMYHICIPRGVDAEKQKDGCVTDVLLKTYIHTTHALSPKE